MEITLDFGLGMLIICVLMLCATFIMDADNRAGVISALTAFAFVPALLAVFSAAVLGFIGLVICIVGAAINIFRILDNIRFR